MDEITITMVRERKPTKLFRWLQDNEYEVVEKYEGIYYVTKQGHFPMQILVSRKLSKENQKWLTLLRSGLERTDAERVVLQMESLKEGVEKEYGDSVLQVAMKENEKLFRKLKEDGKEMCQALRDLFEPELNEAVQKGVQQGMRQGMRQAVEKLLGAGSTVAEVSRIMEMPLEEVESIAKGE